MANIPCERIEEDDRRELARDTLRIALIDMGYGGGRDFMERILSAVKGLMMGRGSKIPLIKALRDCTGLYLKESKDVVDQFLPNSLCDLISGRALTQDVAVKNEMASALSRIAVLERERDAIRAMLRENGD